MARQIEFGKFLIIECAASEMYLACGSPGICDYCTASPGRGYYIAVLNRWFCPKCFEEWKEGAHWYLEDADIERRNFEFYAPRLGISVNKR